MNRIDESTIISATYSVSPDKSFLDNIAERLLSEKCEGGEAEDSIYFWIARCLFNHIDIWQPNHDVCERIKGLKILSNGYSALEKKRLIRTVSGIS